MFDYFRVLDTLSAEDKDIHRAARAVCVIHCQPAAQVRLAALMVVAAAAQAIVLRAGFGKGHFALAHSES